MATTFHTSPSLANYSFEDSIFTFNLAAGMTAADVGKPVMVDSSGNNKMKPCTDASLIAGKLETFENRNGVLMGAVALRFTAEWPIKAADALAIGDQVVGAGSGEIRKRVSAEPTDVALRVAAITSGVATVIRV